MTDKARPRTLFLIPSVWFGIALLWVWLSHPWIMGSEHQAWGTVTDLVFLVYFLLTIGWWSPWFGHSSDSFRLRLREGNVLGKLYMRSSLTVAIARKFSRGFGNLSII